MFVIIGFVLLSFQCVGYKNETNINSQFLSPNSTTMPHNIRPDLSIIVKA